MAEKYLFPEWRDQHSAGKYPFADSATLTNGTDVLPRGAFLDARLFAIGGGERQYLSRVTVSLTDAVIEVSGDSGELATGTIDFAAPQDTVELTDAYGRPAGVLVSTAEQLLTFSAWAKGDHNFTADQTEFTATVVVPQPQVGLRGFIVEGELFVGNVYLVGEQGVFLTLEDDFIRVDVVGDPLARQRFCEQTFGYYQPWFIRTINTHEPKGNGDFKLFSGAQTATDTALRIEAQPNGLGFKLIGDILPNAPE